MCNLTFISERTGLLIVAFMGEKKKWCKQMPTSCALETLLLLH